MVTPSARLLLLVCLVPCMASCGLIFGVRPSKHSVKPGEPIRITRAGKELVGKKLEDIVKLADATLKPVPLDSTVMRTAVSFAMPAVVNLYTETSEDYRVHLLGLPLPGMSFSLKGEALGSGFVCHPDGYVLTNNHVIEGATSVIAKTVEDKTLRMDVLARDPALDVALLRVAGLIDPLPFLPLGDSHEVSIGDVVLAIGNPLGLGHSVTQGIISQKYRNIPEIEERVGRKLDYIQTDTAINPGNSGGPLITLAHAAIGINTAALIDAAGIGFTVPSHRIKEFLEAVLQGAGEPDTKF